MKDGPVAEILGAHRATTEADADLWRRVARGEVSAEEAQAELLAKGRDVDELELAKQVFGPPSDERRDAVLDVLLARRGEEEQDSGAVRRELREDEPISGVSTENEPAVVVPIHRHQRRWIAGLSAVAAAVLAVVLIRPSPVANDPQMISQHDSLRLEPFLGGYELELDHVTSKVRGLEGSGELPTFVRKGKIGIRLVPKEKQTRPVKAVAFILDRQGQSRRLNVDPTLHATGVVEISTTVEALGLVKGEWELVVAVGWANVLPESWEDVMALEEKTGVQVMRKQIQVE